MGATGTGRSLRYWEDAQEPPELRLLYMMEERLLDPLVRGDRQVLSSLIRDDFFEIGVSGKTLDKGTLIDALVHEEHTPVATHGMKARLVSDGVGLVTYRTADVDGQTYRASLWIKTEDRWQVVFHQGTPLPRGWRPRG